ncbi:MAG: MFS transporter [Chloroflexi bacterium]|nr:MFS transporter [Chloroflexota bacterium]
MTSPDSTSSRSSNPSNPRNPAGRPRADALIVYAGRGLRDMGRGLIAVILAIYLAEIGLSIPQIGLVLGASLVGGFVLSLVVMFTANWISRRAWFTVIAAITGLAVGMLFATENVWLIGLASFFGSYAGSGMHWGPSLQLEQSSLTEVASARNRTRAFSNLSVSSAAGRAVGAALVGIATFLIGVRGWELIDAYRVLFAIYMGINLVNAAIYLGLSSAVESKAAVGQLLVNPFKARSRRPILKISGLFGIDSFAGGMIFDSFFALWMVQKYGMNEGTVAAILIGTQGLNLVSIWLAPSVAKRIGLLNTFVWTQVAANICLIAFAFSPTAIVAAGIWMLRGIFDEMDVPTRQSYMMALVPPEERTVMAATANLGRGLGRMPSSTATGFLWAGAYTVAPWLLGGGLKLLYNFAIYFSFRNVQLPEDPDQD